MLEEEAGAACVVSVACDLQSPLLDELLRLALLAPLSCSVEATLGRRGDACCCSPCADAEGAGAYGGGGAPGAATLSTCVAVDMVQER